MASFVRQGGHGAWPRNERQPPGRWVVTWSIAEGRRGRRSRSVTQPGSLGVLAETGLDGRLTRLEVSSAAGLLTLHPGADRTWLHGNAVTSTGVRHLRTPWSDEHELLVPASPVVLATVVASLAGAVAVGDRIVRPVLVVLPELGIRADLWRFERSGPRTWLAGPEPLHHAPMSIEVDADGAPVLQSIGLKEEPGLRWPLEDAD